MIPGLKNNYKLIYVAKTKRETFSNMYILICEMCKCQYPVIAKPNNTRAIPSFAISPKINFVESAKPKFILHWRKYRVHSLLKAQLFV